VYVCMYVYFCVCRISSLVSCCYMLQNVFVSVHWYLLLVIQKSYNIMDCSISIPVFRAPEIKIFVSIPEPFRAIHIYV